MRLGTIDTVYNTNTAQLQELGLCSAKSAQFADPYPELREIRVLHAHFSRFCIPSGKIAKIRAIRVILNFFCRFRMIHIDGK